MSDQEDVANNWRLEETGGETQDRWKLKEAEQGLVAQWQLQDERRAEAAWQPVDYARERRGAGNWVLPSLVVLALVAVVGYVAWIGLTRLNLVSLTSTTDVLQTPTVAVSTPATVGLAASDAPTATVAAEVAPTVAPEPTLAPTPIPTPTAARVEQQFISVSDPAGVNARSEPNANSAVVKLLEPGQRLLVIGQNLDWIEVALARNVVAWVKEEVVERSSQLVSLDEANQRRVELGLVPLPSAPAQDPTSTALVTDTQTSTVTVGLSNTNQLTLTTQPLVVGVPLTVTINISSGLNARTAPTTTSTTVKLLNDGARYKATSRTADSQWVQIRLEDGTPAWVFAEYLTVLGNLNTLPVVSGSATQPLTSTLTSTISNGLTTTAPILLATATPTTTSISGSASLTIINLSGANVRPTPDRAAASLTLFPFNTQLTAAGRSADNQWLQVRLAEGKLGWVLTSAVKLSVEITTLPVVQP